MFKLNEKGQARLPALKRSDSGQALLIVVLVMVVALTVGLSIASKTITNLRTSTEEANSQKALAAAEAGIEQTLKTNQVASGTFTDINTTYQTSISGVSGTSFLVNGGNPVLQDNGADLWLSDYSTNPNNLYANKWSGNLTIRWGGSSNPCNEAALEVIIISGGSIQTATSKRNVYDPCGSRASSNHFTQVALTRTSVLGKNFYYQTDTPISVSSGFIGRIIPLYFNTPVGVVGSTALPSQGSTITSTGCTPSCTTVNSVQRKVNVFQGYPEIPSEFFPYNLFSP